MNNRSLLNWKPLSVLATLLDGENYSSIISKKIDSTYSHTVRIMYEFEKLELVKFNKHGRIKLVTLTEKGNRLAKKADELIKEIKSLETNKKDFIEGNIKTNNEVKKCNRQ